MKKKTLIIVSLLFIFSCKTNVESSKMGKLESVLIAKGNLYGSGAEGIDEQNIIITNQNDWNNLMAQMNSVNKVSDSFSETKIDFSEYIIIAVFSDVQGSGGHSLELDISATSENTLVSVNHIAPKGNTTTVMTQPFYIVKITKSDLPVVFN